MDSKTFPKYHFPSSKCSSQVSQSILSQSWARVALSRAHRNHLFRARLKCDRNGWLLLGCNRKQTRKSKKRRQKPRKKTLT